ncbi:MAG: pyridoxamine 5'-phosphate oxidase family protein [Dehalococcoidia bacterium]|nr:pyridoxamine 5'-phosphate oxidase family protein [Thermoflexaceae bacterium]
MPRNRDLSILESPVAQHLLHSTVAANLAFVWKDGAPRVAPIWFTWDGVRIVMGSPPGALKVRALLANPAATLTIERAEFPYQVLTIGGTAEVIRSEEVPTPEDAACAVRYLGPERAGPWVAQFRQRFDHFYRIAVTPDWVRLLDLEGRLPGTSRS